MIMAFVPTRTGILVAKKETVIGTAVALAAADAGFRVMNPKLNPTGNSAIIPAGTGNGDIGVVTSEYSAELSFDLELYSGAWRSIFLYSCGFDDTALTDTFLFVDDFTKWKSITAGLYYSTLKKFGIAGAMGSFGIKFPAGQIATASFRYKGIWLPNPGALPSPITWETSLPPAFAKSNALTLGGDATIACGTVELTSDDYAFPIKTPNAAGAVLNAWLKKPNHRIKVDPLTTSAKDWVADWISGATPTITAIIDGGTGNKITMSATVAQITAPDHQEQDELCVTPLEFAVLNNSLSLKFE
jgi:hypothetical protein